MKDKECARKKESYLLIYDGRKLKEKEEGPIRAVSEFLKNLNDSNSSYKHISIDNSIKTNII